MIRFFCAALLLVGVSACVTDTSLPSRSPEVGVVVPGSSLPSASDSGAQGDIQPGGAIPSSVPTGEPLPVPPLETTRPPLNPNLPKSVEGSGAAAPVISLVKAARASLKKGRTDEAGASLERALRIEPRNAWVYQALSQLHIVTQQAEQAESEARKSNSLGKRNPYLEVENWRLIAEARKLRGDVAGTADAQARRSQLQQLIAP